MTLKSSVTARRKNALTHRHHTEQCTLCKSSINTSTQIRIQYCKKTRNNNAIRSTLSTVY
ncbi:hypothetical protein [Microviridae sp.]|nr:hypothetical protein [Microviridae sp.]